MSDNAVEIAFRADLAELETGITEVVALLKDAADKAAEAFAPRNDSRTTDAARGFAQEMHRATDEAAQDANALADKQISAAERANNFDLQMGTESLQTWKEYAEENADAKYDAELAYLQKKAAADKGNAAEEQRDQDQQKAAYQDYLNQLATIDQQYQEKKRAQDQAALQDKIQSDNAGYSDTVSKLNAEVSSHQTSAQQRRDAEIALATSVKEAELAMFDATHQNLIEGTVAWDQATRQRQAIIDTFDRRVETSNNQLTAEETQKWTQLGNSIRSSFNSALDGMIFGGKTFGQGMLQIAQGLIKSFLQMGETIAENWIETQLTSLVATKTTQGASALGQISDAAGVAGANAFAATSAIPMIGPELAPAAAASAVSETLSFSSLLSLATGAWELKSDAVAQLHKGEMVVPQSFASGLRSDGGAFGGGDVNMHYAPTINAREPATLSQMLTRESGEMLAWLNRQFRNGALRA